MDIYTRVKQFIAENELIDEGMNVAAAVSGGRDSMALLFCLEQLSEQLGFSLCAAHFEHGIRGEQSRNDADFVADYCEEKLIPFYMSAADVPLLAKRWGVSVETAAKRAREEYFQSLIDSKTVDIIATAHHADDNAESILMHILRGCGMDGLMGIHAKKQYMVRPFLSIKRQEITEFVMENGIVFVEDSTNFDNEHTRNFVRNVLLPQIRKNVNEGAADALIRLSRIAKEETTFAQSAAADFAKQYLQKCGDVVRMDLQALKEAKRPVFARVMRLAAALLNITSDMETAHIDAVYALVHKAKTGSKATLCRELCAEVEYDKLLLHFAAREQDFSFSVPFTAQAETLLPNGARVLLRRVSSPQYDSSKNKECFDLDKLPKTAVLRTRRTGDLFRPLGTNGAKKLKDVLIDKKIPREMRAKMPLLMDGDRVLWAVGLGISEDCRVDSSTRNMIELEYLEDDSALR